MTSQAVVLTAPAKSWGLIPPLGNLEAYISAIHNLPLLTLEEEQQYATSLKATGDLEAARKLVLSHLRVVVSVSRQYLGYGLPHADLIQEGNVGLMKAVKRFDPTMGVRLVSYAMHWIKAEIHEYIIKNWRMVKVATTKGQRKLFFNLRSMKQALLAQSNHEMYDLHTGEDTLGDEVMASNANRTSLSDRDVATMSKKLNVKPEEVREMERRMSGGDVVIDPTSNDSDDEAYGPIHYLSDERFDPVQTLENNERDTMATHGVASALAALDERSRRIVTERWLKVNDNGTGGMTLHDLAAEYGVSAERIRQIEVAAMKKMKASLTA
ncbi:MAG: RNA polymerase sigma factor RpoH [Cytophagales bacterium]|nr:RNA polymerase sigma factor RpoH [Cytophagales bacterium]